jgi:hypothetical protein
MSNIAQRRNAFLRSLPRPTLSSLARTNTRTHRSERPVYFGPARAVNRTVLLYAPPRPNFGLHHLFINVNKVKLPGNKPIDPISLHKFRKGDAAIRIRQNGRNTYFKTTSFNKYFGHNWKHLPPSSNTSLPKLHPLTRARVTRRNVSRVKFI